MARATDPTPKKKERFLAAFGETHLVSEAAKRAGVDRTTAYRWRQQDETFALAWADVEERSTEELEQVAVKRATTGSDVLLIFLLKARKPEVYRENTHRVELTGAEGGAPIEVLQVDEFDAETRKLAHDLLARAAGREPS